MEEKIIEEQTYYGQQIASLKLHIKMLEQQQQQQQQRTSHMTEELVPVQELYTLEDD